MTEGWIKIHRSVLDHWLYKTKKPKTRREAWEDILMLVNYEKSQSLIRGQLYECDRGQSLYSLDTWAEKFNWTKQMVRTFFDLLQREEMIRLEGLQYTTRLTVCKYDKYQSTATYEQHADNTPLTHGQHAANTPLTPIKEGKERKKEKKTHSDQAFSLFNDTVVLFDENCRPDATQKEKWVALCEKLLKEYSAEEIRQVVKKARMDDFWGVNFQSLLKLDKTNKEGIKFFIVFKNRFTTKRLNDYDITDADFKRD